MAKNTSPVVHWCSHILPYAGPGYHRQQSSLRLSHLAGGAIRVKIDLALQLLAIHPDRHGPLIPNINLHVGTKNPTGNSKSIPGNGLFKTLDKWLS